MKTEDKFNKFKRKAENLTVQEFEILQNFLDRSFNFLSAIEDYDIIYQLQTTTPPEHNVTITAQEMKEVFEKLLGIDIT